MSSVVGDADVPLFSYLHGVNQSATEAAPALVVGRPLNDGTPMSAHERSALGWPGLLVSGPSGVRHPT
jgi:hypothetical protein